jgi:TM2 domain-containing membrane protein YozV
MSNQAPYGTPQSDFQSQYQGGGYPPGPPPGADKKIAAGICGILLGGLGIHKFILGYTVEGLIMLAVTVGVGIFTCGISSIAMSVIGLVEGIIYLTKSDEDFSRIYIQNKRGWF